MHVYKFRNCFLNTLERSLIRDDECLELTTRTFDVLQFLIQNAGKVVTKDELLGNVWNGSFVEESNLPVHISRLRRSLGESKYNRFIETVQGTGYRFVAPVQEVDSQAWGIAASTFYPTAPHNLLAIAPNSIAVLPLRNEGQDPQDEYLVDGITESLINRFSHLPGLKVIARDTVFRYKNHDVSATEIGETLGVGRVLTGRVRVISNSLVIGVELINTSDGTQVWGKHYDRQFADVVSVQREIVEDASRRLFSSVSQAEARRAFSSMENADSYKFYLMGKYFLAKRTGPEVYKALTYFRRSVSHCSSNIHAYVAMVEGFHFLYILDLIPRAELLTKIIPILRVLSDLNEGLDAVQLMYGKLKLNLDWRLKVAEQHARAALQLNPNHLEAHSFYAEVMTACGRPDEAIQHTDQVLSLDPISIFSLKQVSRIFYKLGEFERAIRHLSDAQEMEPTDFETLLLLGASAAELGEYEDAREFLRRSYASHQNIETLSMIGYVEALTGRKSEANIIIKRIGTELKDHNSHAVNLARIYLALGEKDRAYLHLEEAFRQRAIDLYGLCFDPRLRTLKHEFRFQTLIRRVRNVEEVIDSKVIPS